MNIILFEHLPDDNKILADDFRSTHIRKVLRLSEGDQFKLGEVNGKQGIATIERIDETAIWYSWEPTEHAAELVCVTLLVAQVRPICMKRILRDAVSLGVAKIVVSGSDTAEKSYQEAKFWKSGEYRKYLLDGAMQSGRTEIGTLHCIERVDAFESDAESLIVLDTQSNALPLSRFIYPGGPVVLAVGPERGWSDRERAVFAKKGFVSYRLGNRILRTETASNCALALLFGRMGVW